MSVPEDAAAGRDIDYRDINDVVLRALAPPGVLFWAFLAVLATGVAAGTAAWVHQIYGGLGVTGLRQPTMWAFYITNFVFWVGIGHAGTLISAILYLFRSRWRTPVFRAAETMTIFAITTAGLFPLIHLGRVWWFYWLLPYPNQRWLQPNFRSPLVWDAFAVGTYFTVSCVFWFIGLVPDAAAAREGTSGWRRTFYAALSLGFQGTDHQWRHFTTVYLLLAGFITPLVLSVHSVVSWDFAMAQIAGWHSTIFAPYFVAGAIFSGCGMVMTLLIPTRRLLRLEAALTPWHFDNLAKLTLGLSLVVTYAYATESFMAWYSGSPYERVTFSMRYWGPYGWLFWIMISCNSVIPLLLFSARIRRNLRALWVISIFVNVGMWAERYVIIAGSLATSHDPAQWAFHKPTWVEITITAASFCWLLMWFTLFTKLVPIVSMTEVKEGRHWLRQALGWRRRPLTPGRRDVAGAEERVRALDGPPGSSGRGTDGSRVEVMGFFPEEEECVHAIEAVRRAGFEPPRVFSPFPSGHILQALGLRTSPVRVWVLLGAIAGAVSGFALTIGLSAAWYPHVTAGMPIVSIPPFVIIAFEMMILFGALSGTVGFLLHGRFPTLDAVSGYDPRFTDDRFGVVVPCPPERVSEAEALLRHDGADEVTRATP